MNKISINNLDDIDLTPQPTPMKTGKAKGWLGEYHWVSLATEPDVTESTNEAMDWCHENLGKSGSRWFEKEKKFYFKDEKDMTLFVLRWS